MQAHAIHTGKRRRRGLLAALLALHLLAACWLVLRGSKRSRAGGDVATAAPNLILLSLDDAPSDSAWSVAYDKTIVASAARQPNGCRPPMTWFSTCCPRGRLAGSCEVVRRAHSLGHELATHTKTHPQGGDSMSYAAWREELLGQKDWLVQQCGIPAAGVVGFRAPYFKLNGALGAALRDSGFLWDSSISGKDPGQPAAPMHAFNLSACAAAGCGNWSSLSLWEVPAYTLPTNGKGTQAYRRVDPAPLPGMPVLERLQADFERKRGSGVPVSVMLHEAYLTDSATRQPIAQFLHWALEQPNTWALTYRQYVEWRRAPPGTQLPDLLSTYACDRG